MKKSSVNRRQFLKAAGIGIAAPYVITSSALGANDRAPASERIVMGTIGCGGQGTGDMKGFVGFGQVQMVAVCDTALDHRERAKDYVDQKYGNKDCALHTDFREVLARDDIDAVLIGTPDHWHALITIAACRSGKDVYCEKPECLTIGEGRAMADAVRRYARVFSGGSQRVLGDYGPWPRLVRGGALGEIKEAYVACGGPSGECFLPAQEVPKGFDWDLWLGPAPWRPYHDQLAHGGFRPFRDYSGGGMTDWGAHRFGAATFAIGVHKTGPVEIIPPDGKDVKYLTYRYASGLKLYHGGTDDITYIGTEGELSRKTTRLPALPGPVDIEGYKGAGGIFGDFLASVKTRQRAFRDIEYAHRATTVCHLGNIAYWLNRPIKYDPDKEEIVGDPEAARWLDRPKRSPWVL
ncbi:MAG: Gfo/Idh/MocA family oxidoreductase [Candidatus Sumerlaeota bacterium]|nr:Gfo/Idh/MocA family oxidoreductase [Candidatus Sumerlaeota bacterium]